MDAGVEAKQMMCCRQVERGWALGGDTGPEFAGAEALGGEPGGAWAGRGSERVAGPQGPRAWWEQEPMGTRARWGQVLGVRSQRGPGLEQRPWLGSGEQAASAAGLCWGPGKGARWRSEGGARSGLVSVCWPPWTWPQRAVCVL